MKKCLSLVLILAVLLGFAALAENSETADGNVISCLIENGSYIIRIPVEDGDLGWIADDMSQDDSVVKLHSAEVDGNTFVARYDPTGDGDVTISVLHFSGIACDEKHTWDLHVENGAVLEAIGGSYTAAPDESDLDPWISGEWLEKKTQFTQMSLEKNPEGGWNVEIVSPVSHGAYLFKATIYYDCDVDAFVYDEGKYWDVPITDSEEEAALGEAGIAGTCGTFAFDGTSDEDATLTWHDDQRPEEDVVFERAEAVGASGVNTDDWEYYTFEGSAVAMKLPADFSNVTDEPEEGIFFNAGNADVVLQVTPVDGDFADRDALTAYFNAQEYVVGATQVEINGVELVCVEGGDDNVTAYATISPEGTTYCFTFIPQSENGIDVIEAMAATICPSDSIPAGGRVVAPMPYDINLAAPADGTYPAAFDRQALADGALTLELFTEDCYDIVDINTLAVGDYIVIDGQTIEIESLDAQGDLRINGGPDEGGYDLRAYDEDNCYKVAQFDDFHTWTDHGETTLPLDDDVVFNDSWDIEGEPVTASGAGAVTSAIAESDNDCFDQYNTTITVEAGRIVQINRIYVP